MVEWQSTIVTWGLQFASIALMILAVAIISGIIIAIWWFKHLAQQYSKHKVVVWQEYKDKAGNSIPMFVDLHEKGRIYYNKKLKRYFFHLKNANTDCGEKEGSNEMSDIDIPHVPYIKGGEVVFVQKVSHRKYAFAQPMVVDGQIVAKVDVADVAEAIASYDQNIKDFGKQPNQLMALLFYFGIAVFAMIIVYIVFQKVDIMQKMIEAQTENSKILLEVARALKGATISSTVPG